MEACGVSSAAACMTIGPYQLIRKLSQGGMGAVHLASRSDGEFVQQVAIKFITPGSSTLASQRRFRAERQILASLEHPNIARLLDGGVTPDGQPYIVMEFVDGGNVLQYAAQRSLSVPPRLAIFLKICDAVNYAHRHLIVHRDIKPGNILVTAGGEPKLIDFGIARLTDSTHEETATASQHFSPLYASPEQLEGAAITTATDIYSLGVLLYELLTGRHPHNLAHSSGAELAAAILLHEPQPPAVHPDLDAIVLKALRKKPADRYASVEQFAADIERFLEHRPVLARHGSWTYAARRFLQRHKLPAAAAALALIATAAGVASTLVQTRRAQRRFEDVRQLANYLVYDFHDAVAKLPGSTRLRKDAVERSLHYLDRLATESSGDAALQFDLAEAYLRIGDIAGNPFQPSLRDTSQAIASYRKAETLAAQLAAADPASSRTQGLLARVRVQHGSTLAFSRAPNDGLPMLRQALAVQQQLAANNPADIDAHLNLAKSRDLLARALTQQGGLETEASTGEPVEIVQTALADLNRAVALHPGNARLLTQVANLHARLGAQFGSADPPRSSQAYENAFAAMAQVTGPDREAKPFLVRLASLHGDRGWPRAQMGRYTEGIADYGKAITLLEAIAAQDPADASTRASLTAMYRERGIIHGYAGHNAAAIADYRKAAALHADLIRRDPDHSLYPVMRGELLGRIGRLELAAGNTAQARADLRQSLDILLALADRPSPEANHILEACKALTQAPLLDLQNPSRALSLCEAAVKALAGKSLFAWEALGHARLKAGDRAGSIEAFERCVAMIEPPKPGQPASRARSELEQLIAQLRREALHP